MKFKKFWAFEFVGGRIGSGCSVSVHGTAIVPRSSLIDAKRLLVESLGRRSVELNNIRHNIELDPHQIDPDDPENESWVNWYFEANESGNVIYAAWDETSEE